jgi:TRAP-type C4-dicarboxylate transport system permease small subunit
MPTGAALAKFILTEFLMLTISAALVIIGIVVFQNFLQGIESSPIPLTFMSYDMIGTIIAFYYFLILIVNILVLWKGWELATSSDNNYYPGV